MLIFFFLLIFLLFILLFNLFFYYSVFFFFFFFIFFFFFFFIYILIIPFNENVYTNLYWGTSYYYCFKFFNINFFFGIDYISYYFILLVSFLVFLCIFVSSYTIFYKYKFFVFLLLVIEFILFLVFTVLDIFLFYFFFETVLFPVFLMISIWGSRQRKIHAVFQFFFYTIVGSFLLLLSFIFLYSYINTTNILLLKNYYITIDRQLILWFGFFIAFAIKIPMFPFHVWLPEAHVEAPTIGSVLLAGILLKLGGYGFLRFVIPLFPFANFYYLPLVYTMSVFSIIYISLTAIRQVDLKKIIAYASIAHMNFVIFGLFSSSLVSLVGSIFLMLSHGLVSGGFFFFIGFLYNRYHTRIIKYYTGIFKIMPLYSIFFFLFILSNISFPGTSNFIGEFLVLIGLFKQNIFVFIFALLSIILTMIYSIWLYNRVFFGILNKNIVYYNDLNLNEFFVLLSLLFFVIFFGFFPNFILNNLELCAYKIIIYNEY